MFNGKAKGRGTVETHIAYTGRGEEEEEEEGEVGLV